jgi:hypothetical protein
MDQDIAGNELDPFAWKDEIASLSPSSDEFDDFDDFAGSDFEEPSPEPGNLPGTGELRGHRALKITVEASSMGYMSCMNKISSFLTFCSVILLAACAGTSRDIIQTDHPFGMLEAANDHIVEITMGSERVSGRASGTIILGVFVMGASDYSDGLVVTTPTPGGGSISDKFSSVAGAVGGLIPQASVSKFKSAAVRAACDENKCDVLGYPMFYLEEVNYFLWKSVDVRVVGFPGHIKGLKNVPRKYNVGDSYWRRAPETSGPIQVRIVDE